jgi:hypothetical protein
MINGIKPLPSVSDFDEALNLLVENIHQDYIEYRTSPPLRPTPITIKSGRKFIKIIRDTSVWGFVAKSDGMHKGVPMKMGDVLKAASYNAPAKHTRGNIFDDNQDYFSWTGPDYR